MKSDSSKHMDQGRNSITAQGQPTQHRWQQYRRNNAKLAKAECATLWRQQYHAQRNSGIGSKHNTGAALRGTTRWRQYGGYNTAATVAGRQTRAGTAMAADSGGSR